MVAPHIMKLQKVVKLELEDEMIEEKKKRGVGVLNVRDIFYPSTCFACRGIIEITTQVSKTNWLKFVLIPLGTGVQDWS